MQLPHSQSNYETIPVHSATQVRFYTSVDPGSYVPPHWHAALEIVYLQQGTLDFTIENLCKYIKKFNTQQKKSKKKSIF